MRRYSFVVIAAFIAALAGAVPARAQVEPQRVVPVDPTTGVPVFQFGSVLIGTPSTGIRVGPFGCYTHASAPSFADGQIYPCSLTTTGGLRTVLIDPTTGALLTPAQDATHGSTAPTTGPLAMFRASTSLPAETPVTGGQASRAAGGTDGVLVFRPNTLLEDLVDGTNSNTDGASTQVIPAQGAGVKTYITAITCSNSSQTGIYVELKSGTTVKWQFPLPAAAASDVNGFTFSFQTPLKPNAANEAWNTDGSAAVTTLRCSANGFKSKL